jgi:hypothetical protein
MEPKRLVLHALVAAALLLAPSSAIATAIIIDGIGDAGVIDGVHFIGTPPPDSSGTGVFESFVRIQHGGSDPQFEAGYNTDGAHELQTKPGPWTRSIHLGDIPTIAFGGVLYYEFLFDSNEVGGARSSILIDDIQLFVCDAPDLTGYDAVSDTLAGLSAVYQLDAGADHTVFLNANFKGSGRGELQMLLPVDYADGDASQYLYFYSEYSYAGDGFEEWGLRAGGNPTTPPSSVPEPRSLLLVLAGLGGLALQARRPTA